MRTACYYITLARSNMETLAVDCCWWLIHCCARCRLRLIGCYDCCSHKPRVVGKPPGGPTCCCCSRYRGGTLTLPVSRQSCVSALSRRHRNSQCLCFSLSIGDDDDAEESNGRWSTCSIHTLHSTHTQHRERAHFIQNCCALMGFINTNTLLTRARGDVQLWGFVYAYVICMYVSEYLTRARKHDRRRARRETNWRGLPRGRREREREKAASAYLWTFPPPPPPPPPTSPRRGAVFPSFFASSPHATKSPRIEVNQFVPLSSFFLSRRRCWASDSRARRLPPAYVSLCTHTQKCGCVRVYVGFLTLRSPRYKTRSIEDSRTRKRGYMTYGLFLFFWSRSRARSVDR